MFTPYHLPSHDEYDDAMRHLIQLAAVSKTFARVLRAIFDFSGTHDASVKEIVRMDAETRQAISVVLAGHHKHGTGTMMDRLDLIAMTKEQIGS